ncbi:MAG: serine hydrolase [Oscillospiraceae bacterium]|nr:serine hydrolase [Oscillospiraceae bacterium]
MNIPRQFYGVNYLSRLIENFKDFEQTECPKVEYHTIHSGCDIPLNRKKTYELSLNASCISKFIQDVTTNRMCALDGIAMCSGENLVFSEYRLPYTKSNPHITNSTCKTIVAIATMFAISENLIKEDDTVLSFFPEYETVLTSKYMKQTTIYHLLTMTSCSKCNEVASVTEKDWVKAFLLSDCQYEPGSQFIYNSMNTYMLAAILVKVTGHSLMEYLEERLFKPLNINDLKWELCPKGIERGGWGLHLSLDGMLKIGLFLANDGSFHGKQLIHPSFIRKMKSLHVKQDVDQLSTGYGYQLWHLPNSLYMLSGMYGQHVIIDEQHKIVIATNAHNDKMFPDSILVKKIMDLLMDASLHQPASHILENINYQYLMNQLDAFKKGYNLSLYTKKTLYTHYCLGEQKKNKLAIQQFIDCCWKFENKRLHVDHASFKLFPYLLQGMYQYPPFHVTDVVFRLTDSTWKLCFFKEKAKKSSTEQREKIILEAGICTYHTQTVQIGDDKRILAVKGYLAKDEDQHDVMMLDIVFPDAGFSRIIKLFLLEDRIGIECLEYPDIRGIVNQVIYGETVLAGTKIDLSDKLPQNVRVLLEQKVEPRLNGYLIN